MLTLFMLAQTVKSLQLSVLGSANFTSVYDAYKDEPFGVVMPRAIDSSSVLITKFSMHASRISEKAAHALVQCLSKFLQSQGLQELQQMSVRQSTIQNALKFYQTNPDEGGNEELQHLSYQQVHEALSALSSNCRSVGDTFSQKSRHARDLQIKEIFQRATESVKSPQEESTVSPNQKLAAAEVKTISDPNGRDIVN